VLFALRLDGLRVLIPDPACYPEWMLAQAFLFCALRREQPLESGVVVRRASSAGLSERVILRARARLRVASVCARAGAVELWMLPNDLCAATDLLRYDRRWSRYEW
jgi:hypothetical protein